MPLPYRNILADHFRCKRDLPQTKKSAAKNNLPADSFPLYSISKTVQKQLFKSYFRFRIFMKQLKTRLQTDISPGQASLPSFPAFW